MDVSVGLVMMAVAKAVASAVSANASDELATAGVMGLKRRILGDPQVEALARALNRAYERTTTSHRNVMADFDVTLGFLEHEAAAELAKVLVPGPGPDPGTLAGKYLDNYLPALDDDTRWDHLVRLRPAFKTLVHAFREEIGVEHALGEVAERVGRARSAAAIERLAEHGGAVAVTDDDEQTYLRWVIDVNRYLRTAGVVSNTTVQLPLEDVFVTLTGVADRRPGRREDEWLEKERTLLLARLDAGELDHLAFEAALDRLASRLGRDRPTGEGEPLRAVSVTDAVRDHSHLVVLGDPGSGKTTLLRYLAIRHARARLGSATQAQAELGEPRLPVLVRIADFARSAKRDEGLGRFLAGYLDSQECHTPGLRGLLERRLAAGGCLVLLDGLDEVASVVDRQAVVAAATNFVDANARAGNRFVVTSRIAGYPAAPLPPVFAAVRVREMDDAIIERFLRAYVPAIERVEGPEKSREAVERDAASAVAELREALGRNAGVRRLAANPLLLTALVLVHRATGRLPQRRVDAYVEVTEALGRTWRSVHGVPEADLPDDRILTRWLTRLGAWIHEHRPEASANLVEILAVLGPAWSNHTGATWDPALLAAADPLDSEAGRNLADFLRKTEVHTGLLVERAPGRYGFPHLTFEEYYAGRSLAFEGVAAERPGRIRARLHDPRFDEPILLALGLVGRTQPEEVERLVAEAITGEGGTPSPYENLLGRDFLFALRLLADDVPLGASWIDGHLSRAIDEWFDAESRCRFTQYRTTLLERLSGLGATRAASRLIALVDERIRAVAAGPPIRLCELAAGLARLGNLGPEMVNALVGHATSDGDIWVRLRAAEALAEAQALDPETISALATISTSGRDNGVRQRAAQVLAQAPVLGPDVISALVGVATSADYGVRLRAAQVLAQAQSLGPEVVNALVGLATCHGVVGVRLRAAEVLAQAPDLGAEAVNALVALATSDGAIFIQLSAAQVLAKAQALVPEVVNALVGMATSNSDIGVRLRSAEVLAQAQALRPEVVNALIGMATTHAEIGVRLRAAQVLAKAQALVPEVVNALVGMAPSDGVTPPTLDTVWVYAPAVVPEMVSALIALATTDGDVEVRLRAVELLAKTQARVFDKGDVGVRAGAARVLAQALVPETVIALVGLATSDGDIAVRRRAAKVLGQAPDLGPKAVKTLVGLASSDPDVDVRVSAAEVLAKAHALLPETANALADVVTSVGDNDVRLRAAQLLAQAHTLGPEVVDALVGLATSDGEVGVRLRAAEVLAQAQALGPDVVESLLALAATADLSKAQYAVDAVEALAEAEPTGDLTARLVDLFLNRDKHVREAVGSALAKHARRAPPLAADIQTRLALACLDPRFDGPDRPGWDYAYDALWAVATGGDGS